MTVNSILRYPGSKRRLTRYLEKIFRYNHLRPKILVEAFVGGGSVFLYFLKNDLVGRAIISDKDRLIYSFWHILFSNPNHLIKFLNKIEVNLNNFYKYKEIAANPGRYDKNKLAEACLFLNRTSFSGILTNSAGPLGGRMQKSKYKIDCRFNKKYLIEKIKYLSTFSNRVTILPYDWKRMIKYAQELTKDWNARQIFFYLDPPFYHKASQLYRHYFNIEDHKDLCNTVLSLKFPWVLSYDNAPEVKKMYSKFRKIHVQMPYSINSPAKRIEKELIITPLKLPRIK